MVYADTDFFLALIKEDDWLGAKARKLLNEHKGDIKTSLPTFIELFYVAEGADWDRDRAAAHIMEIADTDFNESIVFQASENINQGLNVMDAFQAASAENEIISSDKEFDDIDIERIKLEEAE